MSVATCPCPYAFDNAGSGPVGQPSASKRAIQRRTVPGWYTQHLCEAYHRGVQRGRAWDASTLIFDRAKAMTGVFM